MGFLDELNAATAGLNKFAASASAGTGGTKSLASELLTLGTAFKVGFFEVTKGIALDKWKEYWVGSARELKRQEIGLFAQKDKVRELHDEMVTMEIIHGIASDQHKEARALYELVEEEYHLSVERLGISKALHAFVKEQPILIRVGLAATGLLLTAWVKTAQVAESYNEALIQANSAFGVRYKLVSQILQAQTATGAQTAVTAEAASALVEYGMELESSFKENVKLVTMLREGLGVSASAGAALAVTFERGLKQSAKSVADLVAQIAASTGLAAQKAVQYSIEMARALRLLGPMRTEAAGVSKAVLEYASRVEELGGNSSAVVNMFKQMTGGTAQSFMLRGLAGISPAQLATAEGTERAMAGLGRSMQRMVNAAPGTDAYLAQLQVAAEIHGVAADDVRDYLEAISLTSRPLSEATSLQKAYREQTQTVGKAWQQIVTSLHTLYMRVMTPVLGALAPMLRGVADLANLFVNSKAGMVTATVAMSVALIAATAAMYKLTVAAMSFTGLAGTGIGKWLSLVQLGGTRGLGASLAAMKSVGGLAGLGAGATWGAGIAGAGLAGYGLGSLLDRYLPEKMEWYNLLNPLAHLKVIALTLGKMSVKSDTYRERVAPGKRHTDAVRAAAEELTKAILGGGAENYGSIVAKHAATDRGLKTERGAQAFQEQVAAETDRQLREQYYLMRMRTETTSAIPADEHRREAVKAGLERAKQAILDKKTFDVMVQQLELQKLGIITTQDSLEMRYLFQPGDRNTLYPRNLMMPFGSQMLMP